MHEKNSFIHPTAVIDSDVVLGEGVYVGPFAYLQGPVVIGNHSWIGSGVKIGMFPEVQTLDHFSNHFSDKEPGVVIGAGVIIREDVQIHRGWKNQTTVSDGTFIMNQTYIAHDCTIGKRVTIASSAVLAGHVSVANRANLGMNSIVHQGLKIGELAMVGMGSVVTKDIPPLCIAYGSPARSKGINRIGLERSGVPISTISKVETLYASENGSARFYEKMFDFASGLDITDL